MTSVCILPLVCSLHFTLTDIDIYRFRFVTVFQIIVFRLFFSGSINDVILVLGDCHVLLDQGICFESSIQCS